MSGHSKWANIKNKKGNADKKKSKIFGKLGKEIMVAAKIGGGDVAANPRLRSAVLAARAVNMPRENIDRAIKKGSGELGSVNFEEISYEGYGACGVAIIVSCLTDNRNRTASDVRSAFDKSGGNMANAGAVTWMFQRKAKVVLLEEYGTEDTLMDLVIDSGADDISTEDGITTIVGAPDCLDALLQALSEKNIPTEEASVTQIPDTYTEVNDSDKAASILRLIDKLEDLDDVQAVYNNADIPDQIIEAMDE